MINFFAIFNSLRIINNNRLYWHLIQGIFNIVYPINNCGVSRKSNVIYSARDCRRPVIDISDQKTTSQEFLWTVRVPRGLYGLYLLKWIERKETIWVSVTIRRCCAEKGREKAKWFRFVRKIINIITLYCVNNNGKSVDIAFCTFDKHL